MKAILYIIGEISIGLINIAAIMLLLKAAIILFLEFTLESILLFLIFILLAISIAYRLFKYFEENVWMVAYNGIQDY